MFDDQRSNDFFKFGRGLVGYEDVDPVYPLLRRWAQQNSRDLVWCCLVYYCIYDLPVTLEVLKANPVDWEVPLKSDDIKLTIGTERRYYRGDKGRRALETLSRWQPHFEDFKFGGRLNESRGYQALRINLRVVLPEVGPWGAYKLVDLLAQTADWDIEAIDVGRYGTAVAGLEWILDGSMDVPTEQLEQLIYQAWLIQAQDIRVTQNSIRRWDISVLETVACKFHSMTKGHYYIGHDLDGMVKSARKQENDWILNELKDFAPWVFMNEEYKAKHRGHLMHLYKNRGQIIEPKASIDEMG